MDTKETMENNAKKNRTGVRAGIYSVVATAIVLVIVIFVNLIVGLVPSRYTQIDTTEKSIFTFDEKTEAFMEALSEDVTVYHICQESQEDANLKKILDRYTEMNRHLTLRQVDPAENPTFLDQYTEDALQNNSLVVESERRYKVVPYDEIYYIYCEELGGKIDQSTFSYYNMMYQQYYGTSLSGTQVFAGENAVVSAVDYVTTDNVPKMYFLSGHNEAALYSGITDWLKTQNYVTESLTLTSADATLGGVTETVSAVPEDADAVILCAPESDLSASEVGVLSDYVARGGNLIVLSDYLTTPLENVRALAKGFGLDISTSLLLEGDSSAYMQYPYMVRPSLGTHSITSGVSDVLMPMAHGIRTSDTLPDGMTATSLLFTTDKAYAKPLDFVASSDAVLTKEAGDVDGPFDIAVLLEKDGGGAVVWFSSDVCIANTQYAQYYGTGACTVMTNTVSYLCGKTETIKVHTVDLSVEPLQVPQSSVAFLAILLIGLIPSGFFVAGLVIWLRRRSK